MFCVTLTILMIPLPQLMYQNVQEQVTEGEGCDECFDSPCDQSCDHQEEEQPLMKTNNYQFCWKALRSNQSANQSLFNKDQKTGMISSLQLVSIAGESSYQLFFACRACSPDRRAAAASMWPASFACDPWLEIATSKMRGGNNVNKSHKVSKGSLF